MEISLVPDKKHVKKIKKLLKENDNYCPCVIVKNEDTKCMCKEFREMEEGICHCGMFQKTR